MAALVRTAADRAGWDDQAEGVLVAASELAAIFHLPSERVATPGIVHLGPADHRPAVGAAACPGLPLGTHRQRGEQHTVYLPREDLSRPVICHRLAALASARPP